MSKENKITETTNNAPLSGVSGRRLFVKLISPDLKDQYRAERRRGRYSLDLPHEYFFKNLWPGKGITWQTAISIERLKEKTKTPSEHDVNCGMYKVVAYYH